MNINKKNLEILLVNYITNSIINNNTEHQKQYYGELLIDLIEERPVLKVHFKHFTEYKTGEIYYDIIEFAISSKCKQDREQLEELEKEYHINKNCLYYIINILKEI